MYTDPVEKRKEKHRAKVFTKAVASVLSAPDMAMAFRVFDDKGDAHGWTGLGAEAARVAKVFANPKNFADKYLCIFHPDAAFEFVKGDAKVRITCCFTCTEIEVKLNDVITGYIAMEKVRDEVLALVKSFFGTDPYLKKIPDTSR